MKILLMGFTKMKFMPYAMFYLENIDQKKNEVHLIYWNRDLLEEDLSAYPNIHFHEFRMYQEDSVPKKNKIGSFYNYRKFARKTIKREKPDLIISLHTLPGLTVLDTLLSKYRKRYILDFRDVTFEYYSAFRFFVNKMASNARLVFVSSDGYRKFLPKDNSTEIIPSHNILSDSLKHRDIKDRQTVLSNVIRVSFWGLLRHTGLNKTIIDRLANDPRFELHYYGREQRTGEQLRKHTEKIGARNIFFHGEYKPQDRYEFAAQTDIIHNSYMDFNTLLAMGNKYYDGIIFRIPQMCMPGSQMAQLCERHGVGFVIDPHESDFADKLYEAYQSMNKERFVANCDIELERVLEEYRYGRKMISDLCNR